MPLVISDLSSVSSTIAHQARGNGAQGANGAGGAGVKSSQITLETLRELDPATLNGEIDRVAHSISHLERSNAQIRQLLDQTGQQDEGTAEGDDMDEDDKRELRVAVEENEETISDKRQLIDRMTRALVDQAGTHALPAGASAGASAQGQAAARRA
ncbi:hypothetical protein CBOM_06768 [Ceraceosorus bombacis]|uniref:Uncharacterized protein n=1 Tax=Ceraceosorus bombacis TaxID=401625 RepID=A0A0P1BT46_9BASI|nr:hypothetical protein CBOM_06768 [Ceraceosorus bombacis]